MADQLARLQDALAERYTIERELGAGGMATVYLAQDLRHERKVALKVLRPDLAAMLGPERFLREVRIAANLQHPNILPVYDSGEAGGFLYYVMPHIEGPSLRESLSQHGEMPVAEAARILRDVADALTAAHAKGIVHRDIKPENVMLSGRHALVADFGVAKAVSEATGRETLTTAGVALGTPTYMAPEQAAADPHTDHRADLYAFGVMAYEMLTGQPPFLAGTPQGVLAAHVTEAPVPVTQRRTTIPPALAQLIMHCLEKKPADRPQSADELLPLLEALATPSGGLTPTDTRPVTAAGPTRRWRRPAVLAAAVTVVVVGYLTFRFLQVGAQGTLIGQEVLAEDDLILVVEFENRTDDSLVGATVTDAIRVELQQSGVVRVLSQEEMWRGLRRMGLEPGGAERGQGIARELAEREGAKAYVIGEVSRLGSGYQLTARVVTALDERVVHTERATAADDGHLIQAVDDLGKQLRRSVGESLRSVQAAPALARVTTGSLPALRAYMAARRAERAGDRARAFTLLLEALTQDSAFAMAWNFWGVLSYNSNLYRQASAAYERAYAHRDRLPESERLQVAAQYHKNRGEAVQAEAAFLQLLELDPRNGPAWASLADLMLATRQLARAESLALRAIDVDPQGVIGYWNAVEAQIAQRRFAAADSVMARMFRTLPDNAWTIDIQFRLLGAERDFAAAGAFVDSLDRSGRRPPGFRCGLALAGGRIAEWRRCRTADIPAALWELQYAGDTARAGAMVDSMLALPQEIRAYAGLIVVLAEMGRLREARALLGEWRNAFGPDDAEYRSEVGLAAGAIALAEGRLDSAVAAFLAWNTSPFVTATYLYNRGLAEAAHAHDLAGRPDSAIALYERALAMPSISAIGYEPVWYPQALQRLGALHESLGHHEQAVDSYSRFIDLWKDADRELQPRVADARAAVARLTGAPRR